MRVIAPQSHCPAVDLSDYDLRDRGMKSETLEIPQ